ncbi:MAG: hypothetical protein ACYDBQ_04760 [Thermoplasmatota archaeon]
MSTEPLAAPPPIERLLVRRLFGLVAISALLGPGTFVANTLLSGWSWVPQALALVALVASTVVGLVALNTWSALRRGSPQ